MRVIYCSRQMGVSDLVMNEDSYSVGDCVAYFVEERIISNEI